MFGIKDFFFPFAFPLLSRSLNKSYYQTAMPLFLKFGRGFWKYRLTFGEHLYLRVGYPSNLFTSTSDDVSMEVVSVEVLCLGH